MKISPAALSFIALYFRHAPATAQNSVPMPGLSSKPGVLAADDISSSGGEFFSQIVGGSPAEAGEFKFMVSWHDNLSQKPSCGASLVAPNIVLSAAHCYSVPGNLRIGSINAKSFYDGDPPGVERESVEKIRHPGYSFPDNDFMLMVLNEAVDTTVYPPIELNFDPSKPATGADITVIGFGTKSSGGSQPDHLLKVDVPAVSNSVCQEQYDGIKKEIHLCAGFTEGGKDSCQGDSGGPIFEEIGGVLKQVGVVSYGEGCAQAGKSGVYARVSGAKEWLTEEICNHSTLPKPSFCNGFEPTTQTPTTTPDCWDNPLGWYDEEGEAYDCPWYADDGNCEKYGDQYPNDGITAQEACCVCGGGAPTDTPPVDSPVFSPVASPTSCTDDHPQLTCADLDSSLLETNCNNNKRWRTMNFCQHSCFMEGYGYDGDDCGAATAPTKAPAPTQAPTQTCEQCDNVHPRNKDCTSLNLSNKCINRPRWVIKKYCQKSCFKANLGYGGDNCCP